jgi:DNA-binding NarL/FixJ family response regulator
MVRVGIVDDHESVRLGLQAACRDAGYDVVATGATVTAALDALPDTGCDVVVLDLSLGDGSSITENVKRVQATGAGVLVHSIADQVASVREALAAGAAGVIPKSAPTGPSPPARCSTIWSGRARSTRTASSPRLSWDAASGTCCTSTHPVCR